ncbi:hypothetical protein BJX65DRAFT_243381 [Aspergillus insuetus]
MRPLINCQRVCRLWHDIIEASDTLQEALFLKVSERQISSSNPSKRHPVVRHLIWPSLQKYREAQWLKRRRFGKNKRYFFSGERAYLRPEASWRRMLLQQPPTGRIGKKELLTDQQGVPNLSIISRKPNDKPSFLRMHHLIPAIGKGILTSHRTCSFTFLATKPRNAGLVTWNSRDQIYYAWSQDYFGCDLMIFTVRRLVLLDEACAPGKPWPRLPTELDVWYDKHFGPPCWPEPTTKSIPLRGTAEFYKRSRRRALVVYTPCRRTT